MLLKGGLQRAGLHARCFSRPPDSDPKRTLHLGLRPLQAGDAGSFFGREAPVIEAIDRLGGLRKKAAPPRADLRAAIQGGAAKLTLLHCGRTRGLDKVEELGCFEFLSK